MAVLLERGPSQSAVARLLGVSEGAVRYHRKRWSADAADGRSRQELKAAAHAEAVSHWRDQQEGGRVNLAALHDWLRCEHGYDGSLKSVQRYWSRTYPAPAIRLSNLMSGNSAVRGSCIVAFPLDVGLCIGGRFFVDLDEDGADEPQEGIVAREDPDLGGAPFQLLRDGAFHRV